MEIVYSGRVRDTRISIQK